MKPPAPRSRAALPILALSLAALFWSGNFVVGRALRGQIDPVHLSTLRWIICLVFFLPIVGRKAVAHAGPLRREWKYLLIMGVTGVAGFQTVVYLALETTTAINALLLLAFTPAAILIGTAITGAARPKPVQWIGSLVSLVGVGVLVTRGDWTVLANFAFDRGDLWMMAAVLFWSVYSLLLTRRPADLPGDVSLAGSIVAALLILVPLSLFDQGAWPAFTPAIVAALLYVGLFASLFAFMLWSYGVGALGPGKAGQFIHLMPVFGAGLATLFLGEVIGAAQIAGAACVLVGIVLVNRGSILRQLMSTTRP
jgi:drug/metabolite transporter (DMT)-like permease